MKRPAGRWLGALSAALSLGTACARDAAQAPASGQTHSVEEDPEGRAHRPVQRLGRPRSLAPELPPRHVPEPPPVLSEQLTRPARARIIAIGDLHGDLTATRRALRLAGAIDDTEHWTGGALTIVQTGDVLDRGDEDRELSDFLAQLRVEAAEAGGELITLSGNHELMNTMLTFDYVTPGGFTSFGGRRQRSEAFHPGGVYAQRLAQQAIVIKVGDSVFVHGGILPEHIEYGLDRMNDQVQAFMRGELPNVPAALLAGDGLLWTRLYSNVPDQADCPDLGIALALLHAKRMVVGHTPQLQGITSACQGRVLRIDTGMSRFYHGGPVQVLQIEGDAVRVLKEGAAPAPPLTAP